MDELQQIVALATALHTQAAGMSRAERLALAHDVERAGSFLYSVSSAMRESAGSSVPTSLPDED